MKQAKEFFLRFSNETILEVTRVGSVLKKKGDVGRIYVAGLLVAEEENFAFSYNITSLTEAMKKALNRERTNVGRTAYSERVKAMLLSPKSQDVAHVLAKTIETARAWNGVRQVTWKDVAVHACKILNAAGSNVFGDWLRSLRSALVWSIMPEATGTMSSSFPTRSMPNCRVPKI